MVERAPAELLSEGAMIGPRSRRRCRVSSASTRSCASSRRAAWPSSSSPCTARWPASRSSSSSSASCPAMNQDQGVHRHAPPRGAHRRDALASEHRPDLRRRAGRRRRTSSRWSTSTARTSARSCAQMKKKGVTEFPLEHALAIVARHVRRPRLRAREARPRRHAARTSSTATSRPQNIVVTFTGDVKIVDFGIAKSDAKLGEDTEERPAQGQGPVHVARAGARASAIDWRSDIFAAGVMLFELTTGKRLFKGASEFETLKLICEQRVSAPERGAARLPAGARAHRDEGAREEPRGALPERARDAGATSRRSSARSASPSRRSRLDALDADAVRGEARASRRRRCRTSSSSPT